MARDRLRSNVQVRTAGIDPSMGLMVFGLIVSALVLLTMLGAKPDSRRTRRPLDNARPASARSDF
jgi:hypothetical protein